MGILVFSTIYLNITAVHLAKRRWHFWYLIGLAILNLQKRIQFLSACPACKRRPLPRIFNYLLHNRTACTAYRSFCRWTLCSSGGTRGFEVLVSNWPSYAVLEPFSSRGHLTSKALDQNIKKGPWQSPFLASGTMLSWSWEPWDPQASQWPPFKNCFEFVLLALISSYHYWVPSAL